MISNKAIRRQDPPVTPSSLKGRIYCMEELVSHPRATLKKYVSLNRCSPDTEIFSKRRKIYSICVESLSMTGNQGGRWPIKTDIFIDLIKVKSAISSQESPSYCCPLCLYLKKDLSLQVLLFRVAQWAVVPAGRCCHLWSSCQVSAASEFPPTLTERGNRNVLTERSLSDHRGTGQSRGYSLRLSPSSISHLTRASRPEN